jgi:phage major head subunit gpT-like protein
MQRGRYTDLFASRLAYIDEILYENFDAPSLTYPQVFNVRDSGRAYEETTGLTGFGTFSQKSEGSAVDYDTILQAYDKRFTHLTFAKGYQITMEAMDDDIDGAITNAAPSLARAARVSIETYIWNLFNLGFATETTPDGVSLFNASHPLVGGGTYSNIVSGDLSQANIETAINLFDNMVDDRNLPIEASPTMLVIPVELRWIAFEILKSQLRSDTATNAINALNQLSMGVVMSKYLTGDDDWFICSEPSQHRCLV